MMPAPCNLSDDTNLLIAAAAEVHGLPLVHYDRDLEAIHQVTGQPMEWVAPRGTL